VNYRLEDQPDVMLSVSVHRTWIRLEKRATRRTIIAVAAARELAGFAWAICQIE
jgi:hypothetical protein